MFPCGRGSLLIALTCLLSATSVHSTLPHYDENHVLSQNAILYQNTDHCRDKVTQMWNENNGYASARELIALSENELGQFQHSSGGGETSQCFAACVNVGTPESHIYHPLSHLTYIEQKEEMEIWSAESAITGDEVSAASNRARDSHRQLLDWSRECRAAEVSVVSFLPASLALLWMDSLNPGRNSTLYAITDTSQWLMASLGHTFAVVDLASQEVVHSFTVQFSTEVVLGKDVIEERAKNTPQPRPLVTDTAAGIWHAKSSVLRTFSALGFAKGAVPPEIWASILAYYHNNRDNYYLELNALAVQHAPQKLTQLLSMPAMLKRRWQSSIRELVEQWIGGEVPLENTFIYGIRRYGEGARLMPHVDRLRTHAVSVIVNVEQSGMRVPWALEVFDFAGRRHDVTLQPGEMVFYESAKVIHSRVKPLQGRSFANIFMHFRPVVSVAANTPWYEQHNPPGAPAPLLDLGECAQRPASGEGFTCNGAEYPHLVGLEEVMTNQMDMVRFWDDVTERMNATFLAY